MSHYAMKSWDANLARLSNIFMLQFAFSRGQVVCA